MIWKEKISYSIFCSISYLWFVWFVHLIYYIIFSFVFISFFCSCLSYDLSQSFHTNFSNLFDFINETIKANLITTIYTLELFHSSVLWHFHKVSHHFFERIEHFTISKNSINHSYQISSNCLPSSFQTIGARRLYTVLLTKKSDRWYVAITYIPSIWFTACLNQKTIHILFH